jgi:ribose/xylose/arabinose/galactoside ABC-type transport system permease subunit
MSETSVLDASVSARRRRLSPEMAPVLGIFVCTVLLMIAIKFASPGAVLLVQVSSILVSAIFLAVASFGQGLTILLGGIDLSIGVVMGLGGMMISGLTNGSNDALVWALPATLAFCAGIGLVNGVAIALAGIPPFIMTLASATSFFGLGLGFSGGPRRRRWPGAGDAHERARLGCRGRSGFCSHSRWSRSPSRTAASRAVSSMRLAAVRVPRACWACRPRP